MRMNLFKFFGFTFAILLLANCSSAPSQNVQPLQQLEKIEISTQALSWVRSAEPVARNLRLKGNYPQAGYYECRETVEIQDTFLCHFNNKEEMGYALARASCYIEGSFCGHERGTVIGFSDPGFRGAILQINGFDLKGNDLLRFYKAAKEKCEQTKLDDICFNHFEMAFFEKIILPWTVSHPNFVLITFARFSSEPWYVSLVHEIMHAQFFQEPKYREIVETYWKNQVSQREKSEIRKTLSVAYDPKDEFLMMNEFQAYVLQAGSELPSSLLYKFVPAHRERLKKKLKEAGITPVQVQIVVPK